MNIAWRYLAASGLLLSLMGGAVAARDTHYDPPSRVAYLSDSDGYVSYSPAGENVWLDISRNRPLIRGDRLWTARRARAELQIGSVSLRLDEETSLELLALDDDFAQLQIADGTLALSVRRLARGQAIEIATPNLAFSVDRPGRYRIDVDADRDETTVTVWDGAGEAYGERSNFSLRAGEAVRFYSSDLRDYRVFGLPRNDPFDRYGLDRDRQIARSESLRYLDDDTAGFSNLDEYGSWRSVNSYGNVWFPTHVERDWAPYRDGRWVWQEPWGWTWVDNAPWGFAPSHYGRWAYVSNRWGWIPGPRNVRAVYAPALVAFVGGSNWSLSISSGSQSPIGWFPLGPREVYVPSYSASRDYFSRVNVHNTVINVSVINNVYGNYSRGSLNVGQIEYANRRLPNAVTAVPSSVFVNSRSVRQEIIRLDRNGLANSENLRVAAVAPSRRAVLGAAAEASGRPAAAVFERRVVARTAPPPVQRSFADREQGLQRTPGRASVATAATSNKERGDKPANVRVLPTERQSVDVREAGSRRRGDDNQAASGKPQALDRANESQRAPVRVRPDASSARSPVDVPTERANPAATQRPQRNEREDDSRAQQREEQASERQRQDAVRDRKAQSDREDATRAQQRQQQAVEAQRQETLRGQRAQEQADTEAVARQRQQRDEAASERQRESAERDQRAQSDRESAARDRQREQRAVEIQRQVDQQADKQREQQQREAAARQQRQVEPQVLQREQAAPRAEERTRQAPPAPVRSRAATSRNAEQSRTDDDAVESTEDQDDESKDSRKDRRRGRGNDKD